MSIAALVKTLMDAGVEPTVIVAAVAAVEAGIAQPQVVRRKPSNWDDLRFQVLSRDKFTCTYCGALGGDHPLEVDHVISWRRGGTDDLNNLVAACKSCNASKKDMTPDEWRRS